MNRLIYRKLKRLLLCTIAATALTACTEGEGDPDVVYRNPGAVIQVHSALASPNPVLAGEAISLELGVTGQNVINAAVIDLSPLGGPALLPLGVATGNQNLYRADWVVPAGVTPGPRGLPYIVSDNLGFTATGFIQLVIENLLPVIDVQASTAGNLAGGGAIGPLDVLSLRVVAADPDGEAGDLVLTADLSALGASVAEPLTWNPAASRFELDFPCPRGVTPGLVNISVTATDAYGGTDVAPFGLTLRNWAGVAGSATGHGVSDALGWSLGSACVTDDQGRIYVAYSRRVNVPTTIANSGWIYSVYARSYDPALDVWSGLAGSDSGLGLNLNTAGRVISSGYMGTMAFYREQHQAANKAAVYVLFHGDPDQDAGETLWDSFLMRWNINDSRWEALGSGTDASDYVPVSTPSVDDVGGFTRWGKRAQEPTIAFDPATDDVYVAYHAQKAANTTYSVFVRRFNRALGQWEDLGDGTPDDGVSDNTVNCQFPQLAVHGGRVYLAWQIGASSGSIQMREFDIALGQWSAVATVFDATAAGNAPAVNSSLKADSQGRLVLCYSVKDSGDQRVEVMRAPAAQWASPAAWAAPGGARVVSIQPNTNTQNIRTRLALGPNDEIWTCWNQVHADMTGSLRNVYVRMFDGTAWIEVYGSGSVDGISDYPDETDWLPWICVDPQGRPVVSWDTYWGPPGASANDRRKVYVKTLR